MRFREFIRARRERRRQKRLMSYVPATSSDNFTQNDLEKRYPERHCVDCDHCDHCDRGDSMEPNTEEN
jgi:hypothetical protein